MKLLNRCVGGEAKEIALKKLAGEYIGSLDASAWWHAPMRGVGKSVEVQCAIVQQNRWEGCIISCMHLQGVSNV